MVVTNRTIYLSDYCIKSYVLAYNHLKTKYDVELKVYLNCVNLFKYQKYIDKWKKFDFVVIEFSELKFTDFEFDGSHYILKLNGKKYLYPFEFCEPFDREFQNFKSDYFINVDDDFEILNPRFISKILNVLDEKSNLGILSTNRTSTSNYYDNFTEDEIILHERNDTWFCAFKKESRVLGVSTHPVDQFIYDNGDVFIWDYENTDWNTYFEKGKKKGIGKRHVWDGNAFLQEKIREKFNSKIIALSDIDSKFELDFIHYASFTQNNSIDSPLKVYFYRKLAINNKVGFKYLPKKLNNIAKKINNKLFKLYFQNAINERKRSSSKSKLD